MNYIHIEHLRKADELYEVVHNDKGDALHVYIKDGEAIIFDCLDDFVRHIYMGVPNVPRQYASEDELETYYKSLGK